MTGTPQITDNSEQIDILDEDGEQTGTSVTLDKRTRGKAPVIWIKSGGGFVWVWANQWDAINAAVQKARLGA